MRRAIGIGRRSGWGIADQGLSSLTNFGLGIVVARTVGPEEFGAFSLAFAGYLVALTASRALTSQPFVVRYSASSPREWAVRARSATGTATTLGTAAGAGFLLAGWSIRGTLGDAFLALGLTLPGLLLQDCWRFMFFAQGRASRAFANDLVWAIALFPGLALVAATGSGSVFEFTLAWGLAATAAGVVGMAQGRLLPAPLGVAAWLGEHRDLAFRFLAESMTLLIGTQLSLYGIAAFAGLEAAGAIRGSQILMGPVYIVLVGVNIAFVPQAARLVAGTAGRLPRRRLWESSLVISAGLAALTLTFGLLLFLLPARTGAELLGPTWDRAHAVLIPVTLTMAAGGISIGAIIGLRALAAAKRSLRAQLLVSTIALGASVSGAAVGGLIPAAWALACAAWIGAGIRWGQLRRALFEAVSQPQSAPLATSDGLSGPRNAPLGGDGKNGVGP